MRKRNYVGTQKKMRKRDNFVAISFDSHYLKPFPATITQSATTHSTLHYLFVDV